MSDAVSYVLYRQRVLPEQLRRARERVRHLELEAMRVGMPELVLDEAGVNEAWERLVADYRRQDANPSRAVA